MEQLRLIFGLVRKNKQRPGAKAPRKLARVVVGLKRLLKKWSGSEKADPSG
jgi:hypothetical protein